MKTEDKKALKKIALVIVSVLIIYSINLTTPVRKILYSGKYHSYSNDDGSYRIVVYAIDDPFFVIRMPGSSGGDNAGFVRLYDKNNKVLREEDLEMVNIIQYITWYKDRVDLGFTGIWSLPKSEEK